MTAGAHHVTGTCANVAGGAGSVTGTVTGTMATFRLNQTTMGCTGQDYLGSHADGFGAAQRARLGLRSTPRARSEIDR